MTVYTKFSKPGSPTRITRKTSFTFTNILKILEWLLDAVFLEIVTSSLFMSINKINSQLTEVWDSFKQEDATMSHLCLESGGKGQIYTPIEK